jgi:hypothetical protein
MSTPRTGPSAKDRGLVSLHEDAPDGPLVKDCGRVSPHEQPRTGPSVKEQGLKSSALDEVGYR